MVKNPLEKLYTGRCTIYGMIPVVDPVTKVTSFTEEIIYTDEPCRLSHKTVEQATEGIYAGVSQVVELFISPSVKIDAGSRIEVTQNGITKFYKRSGEPAVYSRHQEVVLELMEDKA